jgi:hypothetical protein
MESVALHASKTVCSGISHMITIRMATGRLQEHNTLREDAWRCTRSVPLHTTWQIKVKINSTSRDLADWPGCRWEGVDRTLESGATHGSRKVFRLSLQ